MRKERKTYRNNWLELYAGWNGFNLRYSLASYFDQRHMISFCFGWGQVFLHLPFKSGINACEYPEYGIYFYGDPGQHSLWFCWGMKKKCWYMPWAMEWVRTSALRVDGTWEHETTESKLSNISKCKDFWDKEKWKGILFIESHPYIYTLKDGTVQNRIATIRVEEREWRPRWFMWTSLFAKKRKTIDVEFNGEVGERSGSWKGGTIGCGYDILPGELPVDTLRRMEKEREFR